MSTSTPKHTATARKMGVAAIVGAIVVLGATACGSSGSGGSATSTVPVDKARSAFCTDLASHIEVVDRYGRGAVCTKEIPSPVAFGSLSSRKNHEPQCEEQPSRYSRVSHPF